MRRNVKRAGFVVQQCYANQITEAHFKAPPREKGILWQEIQRQLQIEKLLKSFTDWLKIALTPAKIHF